MNIKTRMLPQDEWRRGPGGNWFAYQAWDADIQPQDRTYGYGITEREAINDLKANPKDA